VASEAYNTACELGLPTEGKCNYTIRMSHAGIPMFFDALDLITYTDDVLVSNGTFSVGSVGVFATTTNMVFIDFTILPEMPNIFEAGTRSWRHSVWFLRAFLNDFSRPVVRDDREHIEYALTEEISAYVQHVHRHPDGRHIDGILYPSAKRAGGMACVVFIDNRGLLILVKNTKTLDLCLWMLLDSMKRSFVFRSVRVFYVKID